MNPYHGCEVTIVLPVGATNRIAVIKQISDKFPGLSLNVEVSSLGGSRRPTVDRVMVPHTHALANASIGGVPMGDIGLRHSVEDELNKL